MKFIEISGGDTVGVLQATTEAVSAQQAKNPDRVDAASDKGEAALKSVQTLSMFEPSRTVVVSSPEKVSVAIAREMAKLTHPGALIFSGQKPLSAAVRKALPGLEASKHPLPRGGSASSWVIQRFREQGVVPPREVLGPLSDAATTAVGAARVRHLVGMLAASGETEPSADVVESLTADMVVPPAVWAAADAVTRGDVAGAIPGSDVEPVVALSMVARRLARLSAVLEGQSESSELATLFEVQENSVRMLTRQVVATPQQVADAFDLVVDASEEVRRASDPVVARAIAETASARAAELLQ